jgi:hypothetical protein
LAAIFSADLAGVGAAEFLASEIGVAFDAICGLLMAGAMASLLLAASGQANALALDSAKTSTRHFMGRLLLIETREPQA